MPMTVEYRNGVQSSTISYSNITKNRLDTPKITNGLVQHLTVVESTSIPWVNKDSSEYDVSPACAL